MSLLKDETTVRLDDVNRAGMEALELFEDLGEGIEDAALRTVVSAHAEAQRRLLERITALRRARGEMPQAADPERSHLEAAGAQLRAALLPGETSDRYVGSLLDAASHVEAAVDAALTLELDRELRTLLEACRSDNHRFRAALRTGG